jgi:hypothetical protein
MRSEYLEIRVLYGHLTLQAVRLMLAADEPIAQIVLNNQHINFQQQPNKVVFASPMVINQNDSLRITLG